jgi:hypothetical protein
MPNRRMRARRGEVDRFCRASGCVCLRNGNIFSRLFESAMIPSLGDYAIVIGRHTCTHVRNGYR